MFQAQGYVRHFSRLALLSGLAMLLYLTSCSTKTMEPDLSASGFDYFPLDSGHYNVYKVQESQVRFLQPNVNTAYLIKEVVGNSFGNDRGELAYRLYRYKYADTSRVPDYQALNWEMDSVWTLRRTGTTAVRVENNVPRVVLAFPLREGQNWNGNLYNQQGSENPQTYRVREFNRALTVLGARFGRSLRVQMSNDFNCLGQDVRNEWYAAGVGLIQRQQTVLTFNPDSCNNRVLQGRTVLMQLVATGKE